MKCKRIHQLKRHGDYWTIARTLCGKERLREHTTTTVHRVTCEECLRDILMVEQLKIEKLSKRLEQTRPARRRE